MTPRPSLQKQFVSQSAKVFTSQERPSLQTTERRRSVVSPERQAPNVAKYELVAYNDQSEDEDVLESVQEPTKAIHFLPPRWFIFAVGLVIGLSIATGGFTLDRWLSTGAKYSHTDSKGLLTVLGKTSQGGGTLMLNLVLTSPQLHQATYSGLSLRMRHSS